MRISAALLAVVLSTGTTVAAGLQITDADTIVWSGSKYRLDGIDAPERAQKCLRADGSPWLCGVAATDALSHFLSDKVVTCNDMGADRKYHRRIGQCFADGISIEHWLVKEGWAIEFKLHSNGRFAADEHDAQQAQRGIWVSCFTAPRDFRYWNKHTALLLGHCPSDPAGIAHVRSQLFGSVDAIKAKVFATARQIANGLRGIYHTEGCASYGKMAEVADGTRLLFFASPAEAEEHGFRKARNCL